MKPNLFKYILTLIMLLFTTNISLSAFAQTTQPKVSIIIPVYNTANYLEECLKSVANQTLKEIEIICIDDGSTDNSLNILLDYSKKDKRIIVLSQTNQGASAARNQGLKVACGKYITFVDSDDTIEKNAYEISFEKAKNKKADILVFGEDLYNTVDKTFTNNSLEAMSIVGYIPVWNKLYKRELINKNNFTFFEKAKCYNDQCFNAIVFPKAERIEVISDKFYHYRKRRPGSLQTSFSHKRKSDGIIIFAEYAYDNYKKNGYPESYKAWLFKKVFHLLEKHFNKLDNDIERTYYINTTFKIFQNKNIMEIMSEGDFKKLFKFSETFCKTASQCGHRSFTILAGTFVKANETSSPILHVDI